MTAQTQIINGQKMTLKPDQALQQELEEAHRLLTALGIPVAALGQIRIGYAENKRMRHVAECRFVSSPPSGQFQILLHPYYEGSRTADAKALCKERKASLLHELLHTCPDPENLWDGWLQEHNDRFLGFAKQVRDAYGIDVLKGLAPADLKYLQLSPLLIYVCPDCGRIREIHSPAQYQKCKEARQVLARCSSCHSLMDEVFVH